MIRKLEARYTGARKPVGRKALKLFRMRRESGETPQRFADRLEVALRTLKERTVEEWGATAAAPKIAAYEGVAREALMAEMPDKLRRLVKMLGARGAEPKRSSRSQRRHWGNRKPRYLSEPDRRHDDHRQPRPRQTEQPRSPVLRKLCLTCGSSRDLSWACSRRKPAGPEPREVNATAATRLERRGAVGLLGRKCIVGELDRGQRDAGEDIAREDA
ncbi:hypothetical protein AAG570_012472 [Ranatra chinensis]|uniref:Uncharacterized protein n=1 Tax=Ranatra chinensis TaxID=642074 RepID=A0ABD0YE49_9HEMI